MPIHDLYKVTEALMYVLQFRLPSTTRVTADSPAAASTKGKVCLFLYHAIEDPHFKNLALPYQDVPPVRFTPMALQLHYQLSVSANEDALDLAQRDFGTALKALHDYPLVDDAVLAEINAPKILGSGNAFRITLRHIAPNEATSFWSGGELPPRLAAYYEVSPVHLEAEPPRTRPGRVMRYGVQVFTPGMPFLTTSQSEVTFKLPWESKQQTATLQPAEAAVGEDVVLQGSGFDGDAVTLLIQRAGWTEPVEVAMDWGVVYSEDRISFRVMQMAGAQVTLPGLYTARAQITRRRRISDGTWRDFHVMTNQVPFTVTPRIDTPDSNTPLTAFAYPQVNKVIGHRFMAKASEPCEVLVSVGSEALAPVNAIPKGSPPKEGCFRVTKENEIQFVLPEFPGGLVSGSTVQLRILVNGAECAPRWVTIP